MPSTIKPRKKSVSEVLDEQINDAYDTTVPRQSLQARNKSADVSTKGDRTKDVSISIVDIDTAIVKYIEESIKPHIIQDGNRTIVPVMYGFPERWQTIQEKGYLREYSGRFMAPVIVIKRDTMESNRSLGTKVDANKPQNLYAFEQSYTKKNQYDSFSALTNRIPVKEYRLVVMPEYVTMVYSAVIFTNHLEQNNRIIEAFKYAENTYWGESGRFLFRARIDSFTTSTEYSLGDDRTTRTNFTITLNGYIIPDSVNRDISHSKKFVSKSQVIFNLETDNADIFNPKIPSRDLVGRAVNFPEPQQILISNNNVPTMSILLYLNTNKALKANTITLPDTAIFIGASVLQPPYDSGLPATTVENFVFYINGQYVPSSMVTLSELAGNVIITIDIAAYGAGFSLISTDEVIAIGKFA